MNAPAIPPGAPRPPGRARDPAHSGEICRATQELLAEMGYDLVTMDAVAARANVSKPTIYRRWSCKADLIVDSVRRLSQPAETPDLGTVAEDLHAALASAEDFDEFHTRVISAALRYPDLTRLVRSYG